MHMWRYLITILLIAALAIMFHYLKQLHIAFAVVLTLACAPFIAWLSVPLFMDMVSMLVGTADRAARGALQGKYYSFDDRRIRFFVVDETIWVPESDVKWIFTEAITERERRQLGAEYGFVPGKRLRGFTADGMTRLLAARLAHRHATRQMARFDHWLQREAFPNVRRLPRSSA